MANIMENITVNTMETTGNRKKRKNIWALSACLCLIAAVVCFGVTACEQAGVESAEEKLTDLAQENQVETQGGAAGNSGHQGDAGTGTAASDGRENTQSAETADGRESLGDGAAEELSSLERDIRFLEEHDIPVPEKEIDFAGLQENTNSDIYAWIYVPDTKIDYPVLQHPTDNTYYLNYNIDGSKGYPGCIYTENYNAKDFSDFNTVLYGHNMKNGSMFANLHKFEDAEFFEEHPYVYIYTEDRLLVYQIFASYEFSNTHLMLGYDMKSEAGISNYLEEVEDVRDMGRNIREELFPDSGKRIITLSTCIKSKPQSRYLVQGVLLNED